MEELSLPMNVDAAAPLALVLVVGVLAGRKVEVPIISGGLVWFYAGPPDLSIEEPTDGLGIVAVCFGGQSLRSLETDFWVGRRGSLAVGATEDDFPDQGLHAPILLEEAHG